MITGTDRDELIARYGEPHRRYHTMVHLQDCLDKLAACDDLTADERRLLEAALWFHDAVYDPTRNDNEAVSARLAEDRLAAAGEPATFIAEVSRLILLTAGHTVTPGDRLGARLVSIDLSILGTDPAAYDAYAAGIRAETPMCPSRSIARAAQPSWAASSRARSCSRTPLGPPVWTPRPAPTCAARSPP